MVKQSTMHALLILLTAILLTTPATAGPQGRKHTMKKGILLVAFGSSRPEAQSAFRNIENMVKAAYPGIPVRWAYTSEMVRKKLAKGGVYLDSPEIALAKMMDEGFTHVAVQSLHTIAGKEFHDLVKNARAFAQMNGGFESVLVGYPLLGKEEDLPRVVEAIIKIIPNDRKKHEAVVLMGHGSKHLSGAVYAAMMFYLQLKDPNIFVSTIKGSLPIEDIKKILLQKNIKKAYLMPFMSVAGVHARNDMAGDQKDSWKSILTQAGITSVPILKGTAEYNEIAVVWIDHLGEVLARFE